ncbi:hypothetical protein Forpe1208_v011058 [Fusarium oxysporum f. sp. rapae]|uniref:Uncharacterized protein n=1 Tax=Fusarium oxysporum f. sp. rapae TaxID=485398 RepID=A0A8J5TSU3_FUSOX|nr:hypothetical protein Forpe1208_v011058 [Fusarium oxysporum f. sp. rapae]
MLSNSTASGIETRKFTVTQDFLYGQANSEGKDRFLVFHDKERNPYQHRFVPSQYVKFGEGSLKKLKKAGFGSETLDLVSEHTKAVVGDELRDFSGKARPATGLAGLLELFD